MKVTLFENCKIDRQGTDVIFPSPSVTEMGLLATATYTFENNKRFYLMGDSGVLDIELRDIPAYECNYMAIEDNGKKYFMFIAGVEKYAGALYELVWELDTWHTDINKVMFRNVIITAGHDVGRAKYLIYDNQDTMQVEPDLLDTVYPNTFGIFCVYSTEFGYVAYAKQSTNMSELNYICAADCYERTDASGTPLPNFGTIGKMSKVSCLNSYLLPNEIIDKLTEDWTHYMMPRSMNKNASLQIPTGKCKTVTNDTISSWIGKYTTKCSLNLDPRYNYNFGFKYNNIPLEWQLSKNFSAYEINIEFIATMQGLSSHINVNGESYDITNWFEFTPNYSEEMRQFSAIKQANTLHMLTSGLVSPTWKSESTTTRSGGGWSNNRSKETDYTYTQRRNKKGQFTGKMMPEKNVLSDTTNHIVAPSSSTVSSKITGMDLAVTGAKIALNVGRQVVDKLIEESLPRNFGGSTDIDALINFTYPFGVWRTLKNDSQQIMDVISMYGYRTKDFYDAWSINFTGWSEPFKYVQMDSVSLYGIYGDRVETLAQQLYEGVRIYNGVGYYLGLNNVMPPSYSLAKVSNGVSTLDTDYEYNEVTFDEYVIKPWQKSYIVNAKDFPSGGDTPTPTPTPTTYKVFYQIVGQSAVQWFETSDPYTVYGILGQNDPFQQGAVSASVGGTLYSVTIPANKYVSSVTVDGATVNPTGTTYTGEKYVYITLADKTATSQTTRFKYKDNSGYGIQSLLNACEFDVDGLGTGTYTVSYTGSGWNISVGGVVKWTISETYLGHDDVTIFGAGKDNTSVSWSFNYGTNVTLAVDKVVPTTGDVNVYYDDSTGLDIGSLLNPYRFSVSGTGTDTLTIDYTITGWVIKVGGVVKETIPLNIVDDPRGLLIGGCGASNPSVSTSITYGTNKGLEVALKPGNITEGRLRLHNDVDPSNTELNLYCTVEKCDPFVTEIPTGGVTYAKIRYNPSDECWELVYKGNVQYQWFTNDIREAIDRGGSTLYVEDIKIHGCGYNDTTGKIVVVEDIDTLVNMSL